MGLGGRACGGARGSTRSGGRLGLTGGLKSLRTTAADQFVDGREDEALPAGRQPDTGAELGLAGLVFAAGRAFERWVLLAGLFGCRLAAVLVKVVDRLAVRDGVVR